MNICIISIEFTPFFGGGIGTYSELLARSLVRLGHTVHIITASWPTYEKQLNGNLLTTGDIAGLFIHRIPAYERGYQLPTTPDEYVLKEQWIARAWGGMTYWGTLVDKKLTELQTQSRFDMIEFAESFADGHIYLRNRMLGVAKHNTPVTITLHGPLHEVLEANCDSMHNPVTQRRIASENQAILGADCICSPSALLAAMVEKRLDLAAQGKHIEVIPNPLIAPEAIQPAERNHQRPYFLFVGRMEYRKGPSYFVEAMVKVLAKYPDVIAILIGKDQHFSATPGQSMKQYLDSLIPSSLKSRFIFKDNMPREQVLNYYAEATACVFPAPWDNYPYTCSEAMSSKGFVIVNRNSGMAEMVEHNRSGLVIDINAPGQLEQAIEQALNDKDLQRTVRGNARDRILALCDSASIARKKITAYEKTIERHRAKRAYTGSATHAEQEKLLVRIMVDKRNQAALGETLESIAKAAEATTWNVKTVVWATPEIDCLTYDKISDVRCIANPGNDSVVTQKSWLSECLADTYQYAMTMFAGDTITQDFFKQCQTALQQNRQIGWLACWASGVHQDSTGYAHTDPFLPYEFLHFTPAPFAILRLGLLSGPIQQQPESAWDNQLQQILALSNAGYQCCVIPKTLGKYVPHKDRTALQNMSYQHRQELLSTICRSNPEVLSQHAGYLWEHCFWASSKNKGARDGTYRGPLNSIKHLTKATYATVNDHLSKFRVFRIGKYLTKKYLVKSEA